MLLKIALNGARPKAEHEYIPQSVEEVIKDVTLLSENGFNLFHIHCYDDYGKESLKPGDVNKLVSSVKNISDKIQIGISSGDWIEPDLNKRIQYIREWKALPDFISLNFIEDNALDIAAELAKRGIPIEAGLNEKAAAKIFANGGFIKDCCRILIEPEPEELKDALTTTEEIEAVLDENNITLPRLLHGFNKAAWPLLIEAKKRGYAGRIGMEDTIYLPDGIKAENNLQTALTASKLLKE